MINQSKYIFKTIAFICFAVFGLYSCDDLELEDPEPEVKVERFSIIPSRSDGRENVVQGCIETSTRTIRVSLWDHQTIDGDIISFKVNGKTQVSRLELDGPSNKYSFTAELPNNGYNWVSLFAHNVGDLPPNTAAVSINGNDFILQSSLDTNGAFDVIVSGYDVYCESGTRGSGGGNGNGTGTGSGNGGGTGGITGGGTSSNEGSVVFYTTSDLGCGNLIVRISGEGSRILSQYVVSGAPDCEQTNGSALWTLPPGNYQFSASCSNKTWGPASVEIKENRCLQFELK